jgi:hypothetical protein
MRNTPSAAECARWLAEVEQALDEARLVVQRIAPSEARAGQRLELLQRIDGARRTTLTLRQASERRIARPSPPNRT